MKTVLPSKWFRLPFSWHIVGSSQLVAALRKPLGLILPVFVIHLACHGGGTPSLYSLDGWDRWVNETDSVASEAVEEAVEREVAEVQDRFEAPEGREVETSGPNPPTLPQSGGAVCIDDSDCPPGQWCGHGGGGLGTFLCLECLPTHRGEECASGVCLPDGKCAPEHCTSDQECGPYKCLDGFCAECVTDKDCLPNEKCDERHACILKEPCHSQEDCPNGYRCFDGFCFEDECNNDDQCPSGTTCLFGWCIYQMCVPYERVCYDEEHLAVCAPHGAAVSLGKCPEGRKCKDGQCVGPEPPKCEPKCAGKECGYDGCGGLCGACPKGKYCDNGKCVVLSEGCKTRKEGGCPDCPCETLVCDHDKTCCSEFWGPDCAYGCSKVDPDVECPLCAIEFAAGCNIVECGYEPCGAFCGACLAGGYCKNGRCVEGVPPDVGRRCKSGWECASGICAPVGPDSEKACTVVCKDNKGCPSGWECKEGLCVVTPNCLGSCTGKSCGVDQYGRSCGECAYPKVCTKTQLCALPGDGCKATPYVPTCGGCECEECVCSFFPSCCTNEWDEMCVSICTGVCDPKGSMKEKCMPVGNPCAFYGVECGPVEGVPGFEYLECGECPQGHVCMGGKCVCIPRCEGRECGPDGCGAYCGTDDGSPPSPPPYPGVFCQDGHWVAKPEACYGSGAPTCEPFLDCGLDYECLCNGMPWCCYVYWNEDCVGFAKEFCGLDCTPRPVPKM